MSSAHHLTAGLLRAPGRTLAELAGAPRRALAPLALAMAGVALHTAGVLRAQPGAGQGAPEGVPGWVVAAAALAVAWLWLGLALAGLSAAAAALSRWGPLPLAFRRALTLAPWLWLPLALRDLIGGGYTLATGATLPLSLAALASGPPADPLGLFFWTILWQLDPFWLWHLGLVGAALAACARLPASRALDAAMIYGALLLSVHAGATSLSLSAAA